MRVQVRVEATMAVVEMARGVEVRDAMAAVETAEAAAETAVAVRMVAARSKPRSRW